MSFSKYSGQYAVFSSLMSAFLRLKFGTALFIKYFDSLQLCLKAFAPSIAVSLWLLARAVLATI